MSALPVRKVTAAGLGGALSIVLVAVGRLFGVEVSGEEAAALTTVLAFVAGYLVPEKKAPESE